MTLNLKKHFFILFFNLLLFSAYGQKHLVKWKENTPLGWKDFRGISPSGDPFGATASTGISYSYKFARTATQVDLIFEVYSYFDKNTSWSKKALHSPELLQHEQVHFDLAELQARSLRKAFAFATFSTNYKAEIKRIFQAHLKAMQELQRRYDEETEHALNRLKQAEWEAFVQTELEKSKWETSFPVVGIKRP
jgi:hypothetical protein